ncbi:hypothetical protein SERLA73DRAFT_68618 [Serpula lacrymans var. lacrymans S7.3]|uniref:Uncharacterized protein n=1 Tax=Serpula lacrymans var. lacrymans (strain S7.3) TaxID=936435 RepID=F8PHB8_SERL3|nr:hypothetical protein SERLA73DRAFT_68618 [Serpula lacrymans var. lacrymans S7.3]
MVWVRKQPGVGANKQAPNGSKKQDNQASNWEQDSEIEHMARPIDPNDLKPVTSHRLPVTRGLRIAPTQTLFDPNPTECAEKCAATTLQGSQTQWVKANGSDLDKTLASD